MNMSYSSSLLVLLITIVIGQVDQRNAAEFEERDICQLNRGTGPDYTFCYYNYNDFNRALHLDCRRKSDGQFSNLINCDSIEKKICQVDLKIERNIVPVAITKFRQPDDIKCKLYYNLTLKSYNENSHRISNQNELPIKYAKFIEPSSWRAVSNQLKYTSEMTELTISGLHDTAHHTKDSLLNFHEYPRLEVLRILDGSMKELHPNAFIVPSNSSLRVIEMVKFSLKKIPRNSILIENCRNHEILIKNSDLKRDTFDKGFIVKETSNCSSSMMLDLTGHKFEHEISTDVQDTLIQLLKSNQKFEVKLDEIDCCRRADWVYDFIDKNRSSVQLTANCYDLLNPIYSYYNSTEMRDECKRRDVYPILTISIISVLLLAILLATFSFACLYYVIPRKGSIVVINDPRRKNKTERHSGFQYSINVTKQSGGKESSQPDILILKTISTEVGKENSTKLLSEGKPVKVSTETQASQSTEAPTEKQVGKQTDKSSAPKGKNSKQTDLNLPKVQTKLPALKKNFPQVPFRKKWMKHNSGKNQKPTGQKKVKAKKPVSKEKRVKFGETPTDRSAGLGVKISNQALKRLESKDKPKVGSKDTQNNSVPDKKSEPKEPAEAQIIQLSKRIDDFQSDEITKTKTLESGGKVLRAKTIRVMDVKAFESGRAEDRADRTIPVKSSGSYEAMSMALKTWN